MSDTKNTKSLHLLGSSHHTADLAVREKISPLQGKIDDFYKGLCSLPGLMNAHITPVIEQKFMVHQTMDFLQTSLRKYLSEFRNLDPDFFRNIHQHSGEKKPSFRSNLKIDSQMVGGDRNPRAGKKFI